MFIFCEISACFESKLTILPATVIPRFLWANIHCQNCTPYLDHLYSPCVRTWGSTKSWQFADSSRFRVCRWKIAYTSSHFILENNFTSFLCADWACFCLQLWSAPFVAVHSRDSGPIYCKIVEFKSKTIMSSQAFRILVLLLAACAMTTCLSLYLTASSRKFGLEFASRGNPQLRLRHTFEAVKKSQLDAPQLDFRLVIHGSFSLSCIWIYLAGIRQ